MIRSRQDKRYSSWALVSGGVILVLVGVLFANWVLSKVKQHIEESFYSFQAQHLIYLNEQLLHDVECLIKRAETSHVRFSLDDKLKTQGRLAKLFQAMEEDSLLSILQVEQGRKIVAEISMPELPFIESVANHPESQKLKELWSKLMSEDNRNGWVILSEEGSTGFFSVGLRMDWQCELAVTNSKTSGASDELDASPSGSGNHEADQESKSRSGNCSSDMLVLRVGRNWLADRLSANHVNKTIQLTAIDQNGTIAYDVNPVVSGMDVKTFGLGSSSLSAFYNRIQQQVSTVFGRFFYHQRPGQEGEERLAVGIVGFLPEVPVVLILSQPQKTLLASLNLAVRVFLLVLLMLLILFVLIGQLWQHLKKREIAAGLKVQMTRDLERMVEARTVELNFVTRTIKDLIDSIPSALIVLNRDMNVLLVNLSFYSVFSSRLVNITGRHVTEIFSGEFCDRLQKSLRTKQPMLDLEMRKVIEGQGEKVLLINVLHLLGKRDRLLIVIDDITERKALERQLIQAEKMAGLGTLMSGIAHEINNPLNAIAGMAQIMSLRSQEEESRESADQIQQYVNRVAEIVKELSRYSRSTKVTDAITTNIHTVLEGALAMVGHSRKMKDVQVDKHFSHNLPGIKVNVVETEQVFINLLSNAIDALDDAATQRGDDFQKRITIHTSMFGNQEYIQVEVEDNGTGISPQNLKSIFDPFFSTKEQGKGTGLGLSISYKIVQRYGGIILVDSREGVGTKFTIRLPFNA